MMTINREKIAQIIDIYYQPTHKEFYVNSNDGVNLVKPIGVFVSLGLTTSMKVLEDIRNLISNSGYKATIVEISSRNIGERFINVLENINSPKQYRLKGLDTDPSLMNEEESNKVLSEMKEKLNSNSNVEDLMNLAPKVSKLQDLINKLTVSNGWDSHLIQKDGDNFRIFHQFVNYKKEGDVEYRVGIFVTSKN